MVDSCAVSYLSIVDAFEVLSAPERYKDGVELAISCNIPRILDVKLQPDPINIVAKDVPNKHYLFTKLAIIRYYFYLHCVQKLHLLVVEFIEVSKPHKTV